MGLVVSNPEETSPRQTRSVKSPRTIKSPRQGLIAVISTNDLEAEQADEMRKLRQNVRASPQKPQEPYKKLLLLGTGDGGKSTWLKQCRALYQVYSSHELRAAREQVSSNLLEFMGQLINACESAGLEIKDMDAVEAIEKALHDSQIMVSVTNNINAELVRHIKKLWIENSIKIAFEGRREYQINENGKYWMANIDRITDPDYTPTMEDLLRTKMKTVGIIETEKVLEISENLINTDNNRISLVDVGGQRTERKKWAHSYDNASAILFFVAISEYDQNLYEDDRTNRMTESLKVFNKIVNDEELLKSVPYIYIVFTKLDLFTEQINATKGAMNSDVKRLLSRFEENLSTDTTPLELHIGNQKPLNELVERCAQCIAQRFVREVHDKNRRESIAKRIFLGNALDSETVKYVMTEVLKDVCLTVPHVETLNI